MMMKEPALIALHTLARHIPKQPSRHYRVLRFNATGIVAARFFGMSPLNPLHRKGELHINFGGAPARLYLDMATAADGD